jgi:hypothetical protein
MLPLIFQSTEGDIFKDFFGVRLRRFQQSLSKELQRRTGEKKNVAKNTNKKKYDIDNRIKMRCKKLCFFLSEM